MRLLQLGLDLQFGDVHRAIEDFVPLVLIVLLLHLLAFILFFFVQISLNAALQAQKVDFIVQVEGLNRVEQVFLLDLSLIEESIGADRLHDLDALSKVLEVG